MEPDPPYTGGEKLSVSGCIHISYFPQPAYINIRPISVLEYLIELRWALAKG